MLNFRKFDKEKDYNIMRGIVQHNCIQTGHLYPQLHIGNLDFERYAFVESPEILYETTWFISDHKTEIGFISIEEDAFYITLVAEHQSHISYVLDFIEQHLYRSGTSITTQANSEDILFTDILTQRGYTKTDYFRYNGICDLSRIPIPSPLAEGYSIRRTQNKDAARRAELFGLATGGIGTTIQRYERMMNAVSYADALDLVVEAKDTDIIAYCTIWDDPVSKIAILEPVACVAEHRQKGITKSVLLYGMHIIKERGTRYMYVGTGGKNVASQALYASVGFSPCGINQEWQKVL